MPVIPEQVKEVKNLVRKGDYVISSGDPEISDYTTPHNQLRLVSSSDDDEYEDDQELMTTTSTEK